jgi:hypothetical protein
MSLRKKLRMLNLIKKGISKAPSFFTPSRICWKLKGIPKTFGIWRQKRVILFYVSFFFFDENFPTIEQTNIYFVGKKSDLSWQFKAYMFVLYYRLIVHLLSNQSMKMKTHFSSFFSVFPLELENWREIMSTYYFAGVTVFRENKHFNYNWQY